MEILKSRKIFFYGLKVSISIIVILHISFFLVTGIFLIRYNNTNPGISSIMCYRKTENGYSCRRPGFIPLRDIPADIISSLIFIEDFDFYTHKGIDIESIRFALKINKKLGYLAYGGSTLTQQLARTLFLNPEKNYIRKYLEILTALEMEVILSKERILELYLNYAEWGKNLYGINDSSFYYYHTPPYELSDEEKLSLITIIANPVDYSPSTFRTNKMLVARYEALLKFYTMMKEVPPHFNSTIREKE
ncbi:MAG: transglycosylase domain-containing protein [Spirochaetales bacterium]|nr:transglycosylase domain-containing protein [Spirochaetales bacterium]